MLYLQATQRARDLLGIGERPLDPPLETQSALGNWLLNVIPIRDRFALLFVSESTQLSFPIMLGQQAPSVEDLPAFLEHGLTGLLKAMRTPRAQSSLLLQDMAEIRLSKPGSNSALALLRAVAADYGHHTRPAKRGEDLNLGEVIASVNELPRAKLEWKSSFEASAELLASAA